MNFWELSFWVDGFWANRFWAGLGARRGGPLRILIEIDGEFIEVGSMEEAEMLFNQAREEIAAEERAARMKRVSVKRITFDILERIRKRNGIHK